MLPRGPISFNAPRSCRVRHRSAEFLVADCLKVGGFFEAASDPATCPRDPHPNAGGRPFIERGFSLPSREGSRFLPSYAGRADCCDVMHSVNLWACEVFLFHLGL